MDQEKLAEFLGILLGDGNLNKTSNCITIVGSLEDLIYFKKTVIPLINELFAINPYLKKRNDRNAYYIYFNSKKIMDFLSKELNLCRGNKVNAKIPELILHNSRLVPHFLRGLFDTDGCLKFSKQNKKINYYPRIQFCFRDTKFSKEIAILLKKSDFKFTEYTEKRVNGLRYYQISGEKNLEKWMNLVGTNNLVHKTKYLLWKKHGEYTPKEGLNYRLKALNLNIGAKSQDLSLRV